MLYTGIGNLRSQNSKL